MAESPTIEEWKCIEDFRPELLNYEISNLGNFRNKKTKKELKKYYFDGYIKYAVAYIKPDGKKATGRYYMAHILVYRAFGPEKERYAREVYDEKGKQKLVINHLDGNRSNNNVSNLEATTHSENVKHAHRTGLIKDPYKHKVTKYDLEGNIVAEYASVLQASKECELIMDSVNDDSLTGRIYNGFIYKIDRSKRKPKIDNILEISVPIPGIEGYTISRDGRVFSLRCKTEFNLVVEGMYKRVQIGSRKDGAKATKYAVHILVARTFLPPPPDDGQKYVVDHLNMDKLDNRVENLSWKTLSQNTLSARLMKPMKNQKKIFVHDYKYNLLSVEPSFTIMIHKYGLEEFKDKMSVTNGIKRYILRGYRISHGSLSSPLPTDGIWETYPGNENYEISRDGRVFSWRTKRLLKGDKHHEGAVSMYVGSDTKMTKKYISTVLKETFGKIPEEYSSVRAERKIEFEKK